MEAEEFGQRKWRVYLESPEGRRLVLVLTCLGLANASEAVEVLSAGYILGGLSGDWRSAISSGVYAGMLLGGLVSGYWADRSQGRVRSLRLALLVAFCGAGSSAASPNPETLLLCRVVAGFGVGAATPPIFALAAELSPTPIRGACITYVAAWWMVGSIFAASAAKIVLVSATKLHVDFGLTWSSWRLYALICALPAMMAEVACSVQVGDRARPPIAVEEMAAPMVPEATAAAARGGLHLRCNRRVLLTLSATYWGLNFGYYGMATWITVVLAKVGIKDVYGTALLYAAANVPGNVVALVLVDLFGRKPLLASSMGLAAMAALSLALELGRDPTLAWTVFAAVVFNAAATSGWASLDTLSAESFGATERATALGVLTAVGRLASIAAQFVNGALIAHPPRLLAVTAAFMLAGTLATLGLKELRHVDLD